MFKYKHRVKYITDIINITAAATYLEVIPKHDDAHK